jgi:hypothetical protein
MLALARVGDAEPTAVAVTLEPGELTTFWASTKVSTEEPIGLRIDRADPVVAKVKLAPGDIIRAIDGRAVIDTLLLNRSEGIMFLDVTRGKQQLVVRLEVRDPTMPTVTVERHWLVENLISAAAQPPALVQVTRGGKPSGVALTGVGVVFRAGDVVRSIDGTAVTTIEQARAMLDKAKDKPSILLKLERLDHAFTAKLVIETGVTDALLEKLDKGIKKLDDTHWEIERSLVDDLVASSTTVMRRGARVVPAMKDGKARGFKLYAIRPHSVFAKLGLLNGDTLVGVNSMQLTSIDKALEAYNKIRQTKTVVVELERRGKPVTHTYTIR